MSLVEIFLIAVGLSMDAFAVSVGKGLGLKRFDPKLMIVLALSFGAFQALMPVIGWLLASQFAQAIEAVDHWIAFGLLALIGGKMIIDGIRGEEEENQASATLGLAELLGLAVATSIDALAVGISFAAIGVGLMPAVAIIGCTTFLLSAIGVGIGFCFGSRFERPAAIAGGLILIGIGFKVLVEHLS